MGGRAFQIAVIRGIPIRLHVTLLLVLPFIAYGFATSFADAARAAGVPPGALGPRWAWGLAIAVGLFVSVLVHELAHSLYAVAKGGEVRSITLMMIGGVSEVSEPPRTPGQEAMMAFVGPATSAALAIAAFALRAATLPLDRWGLSFGLFYAGYLNAVLAVFNLLPAFPMDGGRVLRGLLARRIGPVRATRIAATVGKLFAALFAAGGVLQANVLLLLVAFFVWAGADAEARDVAVKAALGELTVRDLMRPDAASVLSGESVFDVGERMLRERRVAFPVVQDGAVAGLATLEAIEAVPLDARATTPIGAVMRPPAVLGPGDRVADALRVLDGQALQEVAVAEAGAVVGSISRQDVTRGLRLRELEASQHPAAPWPPRRGRATA